MDELLHPRTDAGVLAQVGVVVAVWALALWRTRSARDLRLLVVGLGVLVLALMALRAAH